MFDSGADTHSARARIHTVRDATVAVFQTFYDEESRQRLSPNCIPLYVPVADKFLENSVILELVKGDAHSLADFIGVFSSRFLEKIPLTLMEILQRMEADRCEASIYSFFGMLPKTRIWHQAEVKHPGILKAGQCLLSRIGLQTDLRRLKAPVVYQNHFVCRPGVLTEYCASMLAPAVEAMRDSEDAELQNLLCRDAGYYDDRKSQQAMDRIYAQGYPTLHPFVCERLFSTWLAITNSHDVKHIWKGVFVDPRKARQDREARSIVEQSPVSAKSNRKRSPGRSRGRAATSIVVTTYGEETWYTQMCLQRIAEWKRPHHELIVVVHDESALLRAYLNFMKHHGVIDVLLFAGSGHGHVRGVNLGARHASGDYLVNICIDVLVGPGVVDECIHRLEGNPALGAVGWHYEWAADFPGSYWVDGRLHYRIRPSVQDVHCRDGDDLLDPYVDAIRESRWFTGRLFEQVGYKRLLCFNGSFYCIRRDLWERIGGLDDARFPHFFADDLLCYAMLDLGYSVANINPIYGSCKNPGYFRQLSELKWQGIYDRNRHRDDLDWIPWFTAGSLTVTELTIVDLVLGSLDAGAGIAVVGRFEQTAAFECFDIVKFEDEASLLKDHRLFDLVVCSGAHHQVDVKHRLSRTGVLMVFPPFELRRGLQYHGRMGVYFSTPERVCFERKDEAGTAVPERVWT